jgi:hypothetical protein
MSVLRSRYVTVTLPRLGPLPAMVETDDDRTVVLALSVRVPDGGLSRYLDRPARIEAISPRGIQRVTGQAAWSPSAPETLRILRQDEDIIQRRDAVRVQASLTGTLLAVDGEAAEERPLTTLNVSSGGLLLAGLELAIGQRVRVRLELGSDGGTLELEAEVVREDGANRFGARILVLGPDADRRLNRFINDRQRAEMRVAAGA